MTTKTETFYRIKEEHLKDNYFMEVIKNRCEPVPVHVAGDLYKIVEINQENMRGWQYEKVTHVLPSNGKMVCDEISELQKKVEEITRMSDSLRADSNGFYRELKKAEETIESQKREINNLKIEIKNRKETYDRLKSPFELDEEIDDLKSELETEQKHVERLHLELEEAKKVGVVWSKDPFKENETIDVWVNAGLKNIQIYYKGLSALIPIPKPPQTRTIEQEAEEAFLKAYPYPIKDVDNRFQSFKEGFKAGKESQNG